MSCRMLRLLIALSLIVVFPLVAVGEDADPSSETAHGIASYYYGTYHYDVQDNGAQLKDNAPAEDKGGMFDKAVAKLMDSLASGLLWIGNLAGFKPLGELTLTAGPDPYNLSYPAPFPRSFWDMMHGLYNHVLVFSLGLMFFVVLSTALKFINSSLNPKLKEEAVDSLWRWVGCLVFIIAAPVLVRCAFVVNNLLVNAIGSAVTSQNAFDPQTFMGLKTGYAITTALVKLLFIVQWLTVNLIFLVRDWVIFVLYAATPIIGILWALNRNVTAYSVWVGEVLSNAFLQTAYCLVTVVLLKFIGSRDSSMGWIYQLVGVYMMVPLASMLRNGLQGLWVRWAGLNEEGVAQGLLSRIGIAESAASLGRVYQTFKQGPPSKLSMGLPDSGGPSLAGGPASSGPAPGGPVSGGLTPASDRPLTGSLPSDGLPGSLASGESLTGSGSLASGGSLTPEAGSGEDTILNDYQKYPFYEQDAAPRAPMPRVPGAIAVDSVNFGRKMYGTGKLVGQALFAPLAVMAPGVGKPLASAAGIMAGKMFQVGGSLGHYAYSIFADARQRGVSPVQALKENAGTESGTGAVLKPLGTMLGDWIAPAAAPVVAKWAFGRDFKNIESKRFS